MAGSYSGRRARRTKNEINMVPFIDVMLVLLIIFMVTAPLITPSQIDVPTVGQGSEQPKSYVSVTISKDEEIKVSEGSAKAQGSTVKLDALADAVRNLQAVIETGEKAAKVPVVISADKSIKYETVVNAMDTLQRAGVERIGLSVQASR
jgi:biopolymer transport protein TolR